MNRKLITSCPARALSPGDGFHYFFGYYDLQPYSGDNKLHLCHRVSFMGRCPAPDEEARLGFLDTDSAAFHPIAGTTAWNFQQGAMLQWYDTNHILYNTRENGKLCSAITNIHSGETRRLPLPLAAVRPEAGIGLSINFSRVFAFRPGYGYAGVPDPFHENAPEGDGVFLVNLKSGESRQIVSIGELARAYPSPPCTDCKLVINHIGFNPSGTRFIFLLRNFPEKGLPWSTMLAASDLEGNVTVLSNFCWHSHYHWRDDETLLIESNHLGRKDLLLFDARRSGRAEILRVPEVHETGIHCSYSPDRRYILGDGYPGADEYRRLYLIDAATGQCRTAADVYSVPVTDKDARCDLHARWCPDGSRVSFDTTHNGRREIYELDMAAGCGLPTPGSRNSEPRRLPGPQRAGISP